MALKFDRGSRHHEKSQLHGCGPQKSQTSHRQSKIEQSKKENPNPKYSSNSGQFQKVRVIYALNHLDWQKAILNLLRETGKDEKGQIQATWKAKVKELVGAANLKKAMAFGQQLCDEVKENGLTALDQDSTFSEKELLDSYADQIQENGKALAVEILEINDCKDLQFFDSLQSSVIPGKVQIQIE